MDSVLWAMAPTALFRIGWTDDWRGGYRAALAAFLDRLEQENAHVPSIWSLEVGNALTMALRHKRI